MIQKNCLDVPVTKNQLKLLCTEKRLSNVREGICAAEVFHILVQYYIFRPDKLGMEFRKFLIAKGRRGIPVYFYLR